MAIDFYGGLKTLDEEDMEYVNTMRTANRINPTIIPKGEPNGVIVIVIEYQGRQYKLID